MVTLFTLGIICLAAVILIPVILFLVGLPFLLLMGLLPWRGAAHQGPARQAHPLGKLHARRRGLCPVPAHRLDLLSAGRPPTRPAARPAGPPRSR